VKGPFYRCQRRGEKRRRRVLLPLRRRKGGEDLAPLVNVGISIPGWGRGEEQSVCF